MESSIESLREVTYVSKGSVPEDPMPNENAMGKPYRRDTFRRTKQQKSPTVDTIDMMKYPRAATRSLCL